MVCSQHAPSDDTLLIGLSRGALQVGETREAGAIYHQQGLHRSTNVVGNGQATGSSGLAHGLTDVAGDGGVEAVEKGDLGTHARDGGELLAYSPRVASSVLAGPKPRFSPSSSHAPGGHAALRRKGK